MKEITFKDILDPITPEVFFREYWGKKHLILRRNKFKNIFNFEHLTKYINRYPNIRGLQIVDWDDKGDSKWCLDKVRSGKQKEKMLSKKQVAELWNKGKTFVVPFAEYENKPLVDICFAIEQYFGHGQVNVYASPRAGSKSFPAHGDGTENFLFHTYGKTKWTMYKEFIPNKAKTIIDEFVLDAGDLLYIPQYQYHKVDAVGARILCSIHFMNKPKQSLKKFAVTKRLDNNRDPWIDLQPYKLTKKVYSSPRLNYNDKGWKKPYFNK